MSNTTSTHSEDYVSIKRLDIEQAQELAEVIVTIYKDVWLATYPNEMLHITKKDIEERFENFSTMVEEWKNTILSSPNRAVWIAQRTNTKKNVGFCIAKKDSDVDELEYLYIIPEMHGKKLGSRLMHKALSWMGQDKPVILFGASYNTGAISFYEKHGFVFSKEYVPPKLLPGGKALPSMKMIKAPHSVLL